MKLSDAIYTRIQFYMNKNNISTFWQLYRATGIPKSTLNELFSSRTTQVPKLTTLTQICDGLNTNLQDFFNDKMFRDIDDDI